jgi:dihydroorotate dehydrogenase
VGAYRRLIRSLAFLLSPEAAHRVAGSVLQLPLPWTRIGGAVRDPRLEVQIGPLKLANPVGMAAGFDKDCRFLDSLGTLGFGYVVGGTVTANPRDGNAKPRISRHPRSKALVNAMGFPNAGAAAARRRLEHLERTAPTLVSLSDALADDLLRSFDLLAPLADGVEINVSCPNVSWGRDREAEGFLRTVLTRLEHRDGKPVFVKVPPYRSGKERDAVLSLVRIAQELEADAVTASNTFPVASRHMATGRGGLSGRPVFQDTLRIVGDIHGATEGGLPINACGGIFTADDAGACLEAGATTVQVYTGLIYEGPRIVRNLTSGLLESPEALPAGRLRPAARPSPRRVSADR